MEMNSTFGALAALFVVAITAPMPALSARSGLQEFEPAGGGTTAVVEKVLDGDTVIVRGWRERVRLANVDAPEMSHGYSKPGQPFSVQATNWLTHEVQGRSGVTIRCVDKDRYDRQVCELYKGGLNVNRELVRSGLAWANTANPRYLRDRSVLQAQQEAERARRGLWATSNSVAPWLWRKDCWQQQLCAK